MNKLFPALFSFFVFSSSFSFAADSPPAPERFAYIIELEGSGADPFYELELPLGVYQNVTRDDLGDMRVFNASGAIVPHALRKPTRKVNRKDAVSTALPFFPIISRISGKPDDISIHVNRSADGTIIDVNTAGREGRENEENIISYLIDATSLKGKKIYALELSWEDRQKDFMGRIDIQSSRDLNHWENSATATIARLNYQGEFLDRKKIETHNISAPYLRLTWPPGQPPVELTRVVVLTREISTAYTPRQNSLRLVASPVAGKPGEYQVDLNGPLPVASARIFLQEKNTLANITLYSSRTPDNLDGRRQWQGLAYNIDYQGTSLSNPPVAITNGKDRYWTIRIDKNENLINLPPVVEFSWQPDRLVFLAQGKAPFRLAYGSAGLEPASFQVDSLLNRNSANQGGFTPKLVSAGPQIIVGGPDCLRDPLPEVPWRQYILWAILGGGVMMIGWMSVSLYRQLQKSDGS